MSSAPLAFTDNGAVDPGFVLEEPAAPHPAFAAGGATHSHGLDSFSLIFDEPIRWTAFEQAMAALTTLRGTDLLRVKGVLAVAECRGPVIVHTVQHLTHPPVELEDWPDPDHRSRLVFVTRGLAREPVAQLFAAVRAVGGVAPAAA